MSWLTRLRRDRKHKRWVAHGEGSASLEAGFSEERPVTPSTSIGRELFDLAWPISGAMFGETLLGLVDTKLVGGLGPAALGGVGVGTTFAFLYYGTIFGLMRAVKVATSHAVGRGEREQGFVFARAGLAIGAAFGLVVWSLSRDVSGVLVALHVDRTLVGPATAFLSALTWGSPSASIWMLSVIGRQHT